MLLKSNIDSLRKILDNDSVLTNAEERYCYAQDSANLRSSTPLPGAVVFVKTTEEVQKIVKYANENKIPIISRGAGTNMVGACVCPEDSIVLNFSRMNKILDFSVENMTIKVQPGVVVQNLKDYVEKEGLFYPPDPSNMRVSTIGGSIAQSSGGPMTFKYGTTKDYVLSLTVVLADGTIMKLGAGTIKDAVGYHLNQLMIGSEGTLAIVVEAELKLIPKPEATETVLAYFDSVKDAVEAVNGIIKARIFPAAIEFMDNNSIRTVEQFYPSGLDTEKDAMLLIETDGFKRTLEYQRELLLKVLESNGASGIRFAVEDEDKDSIWTARRASFAASAKLAPDVVSDDIIVPRNKLADMVMACKNICEKYCLKLCTVGHVGDGNIHPQIALNLEDDEEFKRYVSAKSEIYETAVALGGTISAEHGVGIEKISFMDKTVDSNAIEYMKKIKMLFDSNNILNPNKIFRL